MLILIIARRSAVLHSSWEKCLKPKIRANISILMLPVHFFLTTRNLGIREESEGGDEDWCINNITQVIIRGDGDEVRYVAGSAASAVAEKLCETFFMGDDVLWLNYRLIFVHLSLIFVVFFVVFMFFFLRLFIVLGERSI